jgi:hypothetical protein
MKAAPGDPAVTVLGENARPELVMSVAENGESALPTVIASRNKATIVVPASAVRLLTSTLSPTNFIDFSADPIACMRGRRAD